MNLTKIYLFFFVILLITFPIQLGRHFWPDFAYIYGIRHDLLSPIVYYLDFLIIILILIWIASQTKSGRPISSPIVLILFLFTSYLSVIAASRMDLAISQLIKLTLFSIYAISLITMINLEKQKKLIILGLSLAVIWQSALAWMQFAFQHSFNLWILGERNFNAATPGIAQVVLSGQQLLRPYGTFPHPNVLAGFLVVSLLPILIFAFANHKYLISKFFYFSFLVGLSALMISFSRTGWLAFFLSLIFYLILVKKQIFFNAKRFFNQTHIFTKIAIITALIFLIIVNFPPFWERIVSLNTTDIHSLALRKKLTLSAIELFKTSPLIGVGYGQFLPNLKDIFVVEEIIRFYQPVHNIFLLRLAETGIIGLATLLILLFFVIKKLVSIYKKSIISSLFLSLILAIIVLGTFDHYLFTLEHGQILFWTVIGLSLSLSYKNLNK